MRWQTSRERLERIDAVLEDIQRDSEDGVVLVEGESDEAALSSLGVRSAVVRVSGNGRSLVATADHVSSTYDSAVLLTDWDDQGDELERRLKQLLESYGLTPNTLHRRRLRNLTAKEIHDVESLATHRRNVREEL